VRRILFLFFPLLLAANVVFGEILPNEQAAKDLSDKIMTKVNAGDLAAAFDLMKPYAAVSATEIDSAALQSKAAMDQFGSRYGSSIGIEFIDSKKSGDSLLRIRYLQKCVKGPLTWVFYFYKNNDGWLLDTFKWDDSMFTTLFDNK